MRFVIISLFVVLGACMPGAQTDVTTRAALIDTRLPPMKVFTVPRPDPVAASNDNLVEDFMDLALRLESGRALDTFTRFEGPITVRLAGPVQPSVPRDLDRLLHRLRSEAGINIHLTVAPEANITINAVSRAQIRRILPNAACFVIPNVSSLAEFRQARRSHKLNWSRITHRTKLAIFLPNDTSPQEARDCLHEELAQALGPLNDLYRLPNTVFNDDNVHTVLTGYDMLILRVFYDPALRNGMSRAEVRQRLPGILNRHNPRGDTGAAHNHNIVPTPRSWIEAIQAALGPSTPAPIRRTAATQALNIASAMRWEDHRRGFSHYAMGRVLQSTAPETARTQFLLADAYFARGPNTQLHRAYVAAQLAAYALTENDPETALRVTRPYIEIATRHENAALLSTLMMLQAEALDLVGRVSAGTELRLDSLGWARYGFGADSSVRNKLHEITSLNPLNRGRGNL